MTKIPKKQPNDTYSPDKQKALEIIDFKGLECGRHN